jgi:methionine biosynthesis protein MetW
MNAQLELVHPAPMELEARADHDVIARMIEDDTSVLDVGCGDGSLIALLSRKRNARARGLERDKALVRLCVGRGLSVVQGDAERELADFPSGAFNTVVLSHTLQYLSNPREVLRQAARVGDRVIVSIRNAAHWRKRWQSAFDSAPPDWGQSAILRSCSVKSFAALAREMRFTIETAAPLSGGRVGAPFARSLWRPNLFAEEAVFLLLP